MSLLNVLGRHWLWMASESLLELSLRLPHTSSCFLSPVPAQRTPGDPSEPTHHPTWYPHGRAPEHWFLSSRGPPRTNRCSALPLPPSSLPPCNTENHLKAVAFLLVQKESSTKTQCFPVYRHRVPFNPLPIGFSSEDLELFYCFHLVRMQIGVYFSDKV